MSYVTVKEQSVSLADCPRCGKDHQGLGLYEFERPVECGHGLTFHRYAVCPTNLQPILVSDDLPKWVHGDFFISG